MSLKTLGDLIQHQCAPADEPGMLKRRQNNSHYVYSTIYGNVKDSNTPEEYLAIYFTKTDKVKPNITSSYHSVICLSMWNFPSNSSIDLSAGSCDLVELFWCSSDV